MAALPYVRVNRGPFTMLRVPELTQHCGIWLQPPTSLQPAHIISDQHQLFTQIIEHLPRADHYHFRFHPTITNWLPFYWKGFRQTTRYTYLLQNTFSSSDQFFQYLTKDRRRNIKHALEHRYETHIVDFVGNLYDYIGILYLEKKQNPVDEKIFQKIVNVFSKKNKLKICSANLDSEIVYVSVSILDSTSAYSLFSGGFKEHKKSGANSLVTYKLIDHLFMVENIKTFDFEGSVFPEFEFFFRSFNTVQTPYFEVWKTPSWLLRQYFRSRIGLYQSLG